jgi:hypothetical protein
VGWEQPRDGQDNFNPTTVMSATESYTLVITYNNGTRDQFKLPRQVEREKMASLISKLISSAVLCLQLEDRLLVIPVSSIRHAELVPAPEKLPEIVLHNVQRIRKSP